MWWIYSIQLLILTRCSENVLKLSELVPDKTGRRTKSKAIESNLKDQAETSLSSSIDGDPEAF